MPGKPDRFRAYIDESASDGKYVLAGYIATEGNWNLFSQEWKQLLPSAFLEEDGTRVFHMVDMMKSPYRREQVPGFLQIINKYVALSVFISIDERTYEEGKRRAAIPGLPIDWSLYDTHFVAFRALMDTFHNHKELVESIIPINSVVDFVFDDHSQKSRILSLWENYLQSRAPEIRKRYGRKPRFANDREEFPLQAADFWAWYVRSKHVGRTDLEARDEINTATFPEWPLVSKGFPRLVGSLSADDVVNFATPLIRQALDGFLKRRDDARKR